MMFIGCYKHRSSDYNALCFPMNDRALISKEFTLKAMSYVSIVIPFVLAYIAYVWRSMDHKKLTPEEMETTSHKY